MHSFSIAVITTYHNLKHLKQLKFIISQFRRSKAQYGSHWAKPRDHCIVLLPSGSQGEICFLAHTFSKNEQNVVPRGCRIAPPFLCSLSIGAGLSLWLCTWPTTAHKHQEGIEFFSYCQLSYNTRESTSIFKVYWLDLAHQSNPVGSPHLGSTTLQALCFLRYHSHGFQTLEGGYPWGLLFCPPHTEKYLMQCK